MRCPNCGAQMEEEALYCEQCGEEIHYVPDFEPELELRISESISNMIQETDSVDREGHKVSAKDSQESAGAKDESQEDKGREPHPEKRQFWSLVVKVTVTCLVFSLFLLILIAWPRYSYSFRMNQAIRAAQNQEYDTAVDILEGLQEKEPEQVSVSLFLADMYEQAGQTEVYEQLLYQVTESAFASDSQREGAYENLIALYLEQQEYDTINELLCVCDSESIVEKYVRYLALPPDMNYDTGDYDQAIPLRMTGCTTGAIYYTLDGSDPDEDSLLYTSPVLLEKADQTVKAIFVNDYGVRSKMVEKHYHIEQELVPQPEVTPESGIYTTPMSITVKSGEGEVYYTLDGTEPGAHSSLYTKPIPMPLGESCFRFVTVGKDGRSGEVARRDYLLTLYSDITPEAAQEAVKDCMLAAGRIANESGYDAESHNRYLYEYLYPVHIDQAGDFYVIAEVLKDADGVQNQTGSYFAVNVYTAECFRLQTGENDSISLTDIN